MGHTNTTANLALPQFIGTDKPTWLGDINGAFSAIDSYVGTNDAAVSGAVSDAASAVSQAATAVSTANNANTTAGNASTAANNAVGVANTANAIAGTVDAKVGLLANLNTTDRTSIVNAINEVNTAATHADSASVTADGIKTISQVLDDLFAAMDITKVKFDSVLVQDYGTGKVIYEPELITATQATFVRSYITGAGTDAIIDVLDVKASSSRHATASTINNTVSDISSTVEANGNVYEIFY